MNVLFNELSYLHARTNLTDDEILHIFKSLAEAIRFFRSLNPVNQVTFWVLDQNIYLDNHLFLKGMSYKSFLNRLDHEDRSILLSMFQRLNQLDGANHPLVTQPTLNLSTNSVSTFLHSCQINYGMLSVFSHLVWGSTTVDFNATSGSLHMPNWPDFSFTGNATAYLNNFKSFFIKFLPQVTPEAGFFLPYRKISNIILRDEKFSAYRKSLPPQGQFAMFQSLGSAIAELNGYDERPDLNAINSSTAKKRNIFESKNTGDFLSIDYEKGAFEYLNPSGSHLGEFSFDGRKLQNADDKGKHDIKLSK